MYMYIYMCVCVRLCVCVGVCACACACACVDDLDNNTTQWCLEMFKIMAINNISKKVQLLCLTVLCSIDTRRRSYQLFV